MTSTAPQIATPAPRRSASVVLLPGEKFFVRRIPLTPGQDAAGQVELALETFGPFSPAQIFHGFCPSRDGTQALFFAAYRKNFTAEEISSWATADLVLPDFALWLAPATPPSASTWLYEGDGALQLIVWDGSELPAGLLFRKTDDAIPGAAADEILEEAAKRFDASKGSPRRLGGNVVIERWGKEGLGLKLDKPGQTMATVLPVAVARSMDVRDKAELAALAQAQQRENWLWRSFVGVVVALILCAVLEVGLQVGATLLERRQQAVKANAVAVHKIEQENTLAAQMEQRAGQKLKLIEMLALLNMHRPSSILFKQASTSSSRQMNVNAEGNNAADISNYQAALEKIPGVEKAEFSNQHSQQGGVAFDLKVTFKPDFDVEAERK